MKIRFIVAILALGLSFCLFGKNKNEVNLKITEDVTADTATMICSKADNGKLLCKPIESGDVIFTSKNLITISGPISSKSASDFIKGFHELEYKDEVQKIYVYIRSPGGSVFAGQKMADIMKASKKEVVVVIDTAISMAFHISHFGSKRLIIPSGTMMQHHASGGTGGGEFPNVDKQWNWIKRVVNKMDHQDAAACLKISYEQFMKNKDRDWWLLPEEALEAGCVDSIATKVLCSKDLINSTREEVHEFWGITVTLTWSGCPLETYPRDIKITRQYEKWKPLSEKQKQIANEYMQILTDPLSFYKNRGNLDLDYYLFPQKEELE